MPVTPALSAYLDFLRFIAALAVLFGHMDLDGMSADWMPLTHLSHEAVIVFFVLSGFIVCHTTLARELTWRRYAVLRLSRVYSVVFPAVVTCFLMVSVVEGFANVELSKLSNYREPAIGDFLFSLFFLNESWLPGTAVPLNHPYWTLCYEVWFYVIFGCFFFASGVTRVLLVGLAMLVAGPAILLLLPIWLFGVWLAASGKYRTAWRTPCATVGFVLFGVVLWLISMFNIDLHLQRFLHGVIPGYWRLDGSQRFVTDYVIGAAICLHIAAFSSLPATWQGFFERYRSWFAALAGFSFTLYLFHRPMTQILGAWWPQPQGAVLWPMLMAVAILLACWIISWGTERQLHRWRRLFSRLLQPA